LLLLMVMMMLLRVPRWWRLRIAMAFVSRMASCGANACSSCGHCNGVVVQYPLSRKHAKDVGHGRGVGGVSRPVGQHFQPETRWQHRCQPALRDARVLAQASTRCRSRMRVASKPERRSKSACARRHCPGTTETHHVAIVQRCCEAFGRSISNGVLNAIRTTQYGSGSTISQTP